MFFVKFLFLDFCIMKDLILPLPVRIKRVLGCVPNSISNELSKVVMPFPSDKDKNR